MVNIKDAAKSVVQKWDFQKTLTKYKDTKNFEINKQGRFAARAVQVFLGIISFYWISKIGQNSAFNINFGMTNIQTAILAFSVMSPMVTICLFSIYFFGFFSKAWTSRRILTIETVSDIIMTIIWFALFISGLVQVGGNCASGTAMAGCTDFNWVTAWIFFIAISWLVNLVFDGTAWHFAFGGFNEIDDNILMDIRRTTRNPSRYK